MEVFGLLLTLLLGQPGAVAALTHPEIAFDRRTRSVGGWRRQAAGNVEASPGTRAALLLGGDPAAVTRCVRLNNYWCIKRAGWAGEIAADADGHVAFASAAEGATVAALLLRRYYMDYGRHSALAIVSRWAPASCGGQAAAASASGRSRPGGTLRARWLAAHRVAGQGRGRGRGHALGVGRVSTVPDRLIGTTLPATTIALGLAAAPIGLAAALPERSVGGTPSPPACAGDTLRIAAYAARAAGGIAPSVTSDLGLFDARGVATPHLARLMRNMASVEIGPLGAGEALVEAAVAHAADAVAARRGPATGAAAPGRLDEARRPEPHP